MSKKRKFVARIKARTLDPTPEEFLQAVQKAEQLVISTMQEKHQKLPPVQALTFLALCTKAVLVNSSTFTATDGELIRIVKQILAFPAYQPGPQFPYTKQHMFMAWKMADENEEGA